MRTEGTEQIAPFACDMSALSPVERQEHVATTKEVFGAVKEVLELADGYAFRLPSEASLLMRTAAFVEKERLCCPFFRFGIELEPGGELWLSLRGREGVKPFIRAEIGGALTEAVTQEAGFA